MKRWLVTFVLAAAAATLPSVAADRDTDAMFEDARQAAHAGDRETARELCREILELRPDHADAAVLLGRLHGWDGEHARAGEILTRAVDEHPDYVEARGALADHYLWTNRHDAALAQTVAGLEREPDHAGLLHRKSRALAALGRTDEALAAARRSYEIEPDPAVRRHVRGLLDGHYRNEVEAEVEIESFDDDTDTWRSGFVSYRRTFDWGDLIGRLNVADRFDDTGTQLEVDAYPRLRPRTYLYLNFGVSSSDVFPDVRFGAEIFQGFAGSWEGSFGFRRLDFDEVEVTIWTGSVSKYWRTYWFSARPYWVDQEHGDARSLALFARRYFSARWEYAELSAAFGNGDADVPIVGAITAREVENLDSFRLRAELRRRMTDSVIVHGFLGTRTEELTFGRERDSVFFGAGVEKLF
jgi:YaiO family outer membrane protein